MFYSDSYPIEDLSPNRNINRGEGSSQCDINHNSVLLDNTTEVPGADSLYLFSDSMQLSERQAFCLSVGKYLSIYFKGTDKTLSYSQS